jgi:hypothetical protein
LSTDEIQYPNLIICTQEDLNLESVPEYFERINLQAINKNDLKSPTVLINSTYIYRKQTQVCLIFDIPTYVKGSWMIIVSSKFQKIQINEFDSHAAESNFIFPNLSLNNCSSKAVFGLKLYQFTRKWQFWSRCLTEKKRFAYYESCGFQLLSSSAAQHLNTNQIVDQSKETLDCIHEQLTSEYCNQKVVIVDKLLQEWEYSSNLLTEENQIGLQLLNSSIEFHNTNVISTFHFSILIVQLTFIAFGLSLLPRLSQIFNFIQNRRAKRNSNATTETI